MRGSILKKNSRLKEQLNKYKLYIKISLALPFTTLRKKMFPLMAASKFTKVKKLEIHTFD
jgi:hypothetical protein